MQESADFFRKKFADLKIGDILIESFFLERTNKIET